MAFGSDFRRATNLLAVALVMLIPFTTQGISDPESSQFALPTAMYALNIALASLAQIGFAEVDAEDERPDGAWIMLVIQRNHPPGN